jgi:hypothetical protein
MLDQLKTALSIRSCQQMFLDKVREYAFEFSTTRPLTLSQSLKRSIAQSLNRQNAVLSLHLVSLISPQDIMCSLRDCSFAPLPSHTSSSSPNLPLHSHYTLFLTPL